MPTTALAATAVAFLGPPAKEWRSCVPKLPRSAAKQLGVDGATTAFPSRH